MTGLTGRAGLAAPQPRRLAAVLLAACLAGGLHAALTFGEVWLRRDAVYQQTMRTADERQRDQRLAAWRAEQARRGHAVAPAEVREKARALTPPRGFPFARLLAACALISVALGAGSLRREALEPAASSLAVTAISPRLLAGTAVAALLAIAAVALLDVW